MTKDEIITQITTVVTRMLAEKGEKGADIRPETELLGGAVGIDSLDLAVLVRELEEIVGHDPFANGFIDFRTVDELASLYAR